MYEVRCVDTEILKTVGDGRFHNTVFTTFEWVMFLKKNQNADPVVLELSENHEICAYFVGLTIKKFGVKIMGSPFEGWLTPDMGFIRVKPINESEAYNAVAKYCLKNLKCWYIQITDKKTEEKNLGSSIHYELSKSLNMDISRSSDEIISTFTKSTKKCIRQFDHRGASISQVPFSHEFARQFYDQLKDVFAKQGLTPNYTEQKIHDMVDALANTPEYVLAMQVKSPEGECIASSIYLGLDEWCYSMATASYRSGQHYLPNERIRWFGIQYWKERGATKFDLVGYREYKMKFSPEIIMRPTVTFSKYRFLPFMKKTARKVIEIYRKVRGT